MCATARSFHLQISIFESHNCLWVDKSRFVLKMDIVEDFQNLDIFVDENEFEEHSDKRPTCQECLRWCK